MEKHLSFWRWVGAIVISTMAMVSAAEAKVYAKYHKHRHYKHRIYRYPRQKSPPKQTELKPLDLSVPFHTVALPEVSRPLNGLEPSKQRAFIENSKLKPRDLQVKGQVVMLQEPEADKSKSVDGAGIVINLRR
jgi:hypothetical protein